MIKCSVLVLGATLLAASVGGFVAAPLLADAAPVETTLRFEKTVEYQVDVPIPLEAKVGAVRIFTVEFRPGKGGTRSAPLRVVFDGENVGPDEWFVHFKVDLLDDAGAVLESGQARQKYNVRIEKAQVHLRVENRVLSQVRKARIRITAEMD